MQCIVYLLISQQNALYCLSINHKGQDALYCLSIYHIEQKCIVLSIYHLSRGMRKPAFCICEKNMQISLAVPTKLISAIVFAT